jgi:hypothetical protein
MRTLKRSLPALLCALVVGGCADDEPIPLFEEKGTWALFRYDLDGMGVMPIDVQERVDGFLLNFNPDKGIVAAATCIDSMGRTDITQTLCDIDEFVCRCFNYTFEETTMLWTEFEGSSEPPVPPEDSTAAKPGDTISIEVSQFGDTSSTYNYSILPYGLFNSDGETTKYVFQIRGDDKFAATGCYEVCGSAPEAPPAE